MRLLLLTLMYYFIWGEYATSGGEETFLLKL